MRFLRGMLASSIGKKQAVALSGLLLIGFLFSHLAGNLLMLKSREAFDGYAEFLEHHPLLIPAEIILALIFLSHIVLGLKVSLDNRMARPEGYASQVSSGGRTLGSSTMKYTGLMTLVFLCVHIWTFKLGHPEGSSLWEWVVYNFQTPWYMGFYLLAIIFLGVHLSHGVKSAFQTFGFNHPVYTPWIDRAGVALAVLLAAGFGVLPLWGFLRGG